MTGFLRLQCYGKGDDRVNQGLLSVYFQRCSLVHIQWYLVTCMSHKRLIQFQASKETHSKPYYKKGIGGELALEIFFFFLIDEFGKI